jgi:trimethylamine---corrinoid protein Co-methyltransferase
MNSTVRPRFSLLGEEQKAFVHQRSLEILSSTGVRIHSRQVVEVLRASHGVVVEEPRGSDGARAFFEEGLVSWAVETAAGEVDLFGRHGDVAFRLGADRARFGVGVTNLYYQDPSTDEVTLHPAAHGHDHTPGP